MPLLKKKYFHSSLFDNLHLLAASIFTLKIMQTFTFSVLSSLRFRQFFKIRLKQKPIQRTVFLLPPAAAAAAAVSL